MNKTDLGTNFKFYRWDDEQAEIVAIDKGEGCNELKMSFSEARPLFDAKELEGQIVIRGGRGSFFVEQYLKKQSLMKKRYRQIKALKKELKATKSRQ